jgi:hypothetical protein
VVVAGCVGTSACKREPVGQIAGAASSAPAASIETSSVPRVVGNVNLTPGMPIKLCIRPREPGNPFAPNATDYDCSTEVAATQAPWGGGGVSGSAIFAAVRRVHPRSGIIYARSLDPGDDPVRSGVTGIEIDDDDNQYFGKYARKDGRGRAVMFIEVEKP